MEFCKCNKCGNFVTFIEGPHCTPVCCGETMEKLVAGTSDGAREKHVPAVTVEGNVVTAKVGEVEHPMLEKHYIQFIALETSKGCHITKLAPGEKPEAVFTLAEGEKPVAVYEYCNLHGLWKAEV